MARIITLQDEVAYSNEQYGVTAHLSADAIDDSAERLGAIIDWHGYPVEVWFGGEDDRQRWLLGTETGVAALVDESGTRRSARLVGSTGDDTLRWVATN
jgi:hypothetical protein